MRKLKLHRTTKIVLAIILVILAVPFSACKITGPQGRTDSTEPDGPNATTKKPTLNVTPIPDGQIVNLMATLKAKPDVKAAETDAARAAILNDFSVRLIRAQLAEREKEQKNKSNFLLSPYVMQSVLTMVANGAAGDTLSEMLAVLAGKSGEGGESDKVTGDAGSDADKVGKAADATLRALNELMLGTRRDSEREAQQLFINGSIWYRTGASYFRINPDFLQTNADYFGIPAFGAPFDNATVKAMNDLIAEQTKGLIKEIIKELKRENCIALFSTLLFEAKWLNPFGPGYEAENWFTNIDGKQQTVRVMGSSDEPVFAVKGGEATLRPYAGENYGMLLILSDEGTLPTDLLKSWTADDWYTAIIDSQRAAGSTQDATIALPAFTFCTELDDMIPVLKAMGMELVFDDWVADLSAMGSAAGPLYVSELKHKAKIIVNEKGTIAAAVGHAMVTCGSVAPEPTKYLIFDRPFAYAIVDLNTGVPYFVGAMNSIDETPSTSTTDLS